jgi:hypothetical protein
MPVMPGLRIRPKESLLAFCDEASHNRERYFVLGAVYFVPEEGGDSATTLTAVEQYLTELKRQHSLFERVKWGKLPTRPGKYFEGYKEFIRSFLETDGVGFKCLVVDTHKYPLNNSKLWGGDALVGYQKFYCVFLADGLMKRYPNRYYEVVVDEFAGVSCTDLERTVEGRYVKRAKPTAAMYHCSVKAGNERQSNLLQLTDLLVGAVGFAWNGGAERKSARAKMRVEIVNWLEKELNLKLSQGTAWSSLKFNIWVLEPK